MYNFYYESEGQAVGPFSAKDMADMNLPEEMLVTEDSLNGEWRYARDFNFQELANMEFSEYDAPSNNNNDGSAEYAIEDTVQQEGNDEASDGMTDEEFQEWRKKKQEQYEKERKKSDGVGNIITGVVALAFGIGITLLTGGSVIKIGLIIFGLYMIIKGLL